MRGWITDAKDIRARKIHWYQGAYNERLFEGWDEGEEPAGRLQCYALDLVQIDSAG